ncbi:hypothetical protein ACL9RF_16845 [Sphingobacterium sp. Mn56C]|uniref:hypothetical protein n=1 Tax=Sphingobacterium sp. Mn56C TaxID=3395261 RepID=UPI003BDA87E1
MKRLFTLLLCIFYAAVSFGGSVYLHQCGGKTSLSLFDNASHASCPMCQTAHAKTSLPAQEQENSMYCKTGKCTDIEVKIDSLSDKHFPGQNTTSFTFTPAIVPLLWIGLKPVEKIVNTMPLQAYAGYGFSNTSPPAFLLNCIFRI